VDEEGVLRAVPSFVLPLFALLFHATACAPNPAPLVGTAGAGALAPAAGDAFRDTFPAGVFDADALSAGEILDPARAAAMTAPPAITRAPPLLPVLPPVTPAPAPGGVLLPGTASEGVISV
jgi:hypothetical protein